MRLCLANGIVAAVAGVTLCGSLACAARRQPAPRPPVVVVFDEREGRLSAALGRHVTVDDRPVSDSLPAPAERAHRALVAAYSDLGIPDVIANPAIGLVAIAEHRVRGTLARQRPSRFISCGTTLTGPRADEDLLVVTVVSRLRAAGPATTVVETRVVGTSMDTRGTGARQACTSTGQLEVRLHEAAKAALASG
jgi:hypothetical protein